MASETVQKILNAEAESQRKNSDAARRKEELINDAKGRSSEAVQKRISDAVKETEKLKAEYEAKLKEYVKSADKKRDDELSELGSLAEKNSDKAVNAVIKEYF